MGFLNNEEIQRARMLAYEIADFFSAIRNEINLDKPSIEYLQEKIRGLKQDVNCLDYLINKEDN